MASKMIKLYDKDGNWCQPMTNHLVSSGKIEKNCDFNNYLTQGEFSVAYGTGETAPLNAPYSGSIWGKLFVEINDNSTQNNTSNWLWQTFVDTSGRTYKREKNNNASFKPWRRVYSETVLYSNASGTTGTVTLNEPAERFQYLEIFAERNSWSYSTRVWYPNGKTVTLSASYSTGSYMYLYSKLININETSITVNFQKLLWMNSNDKGFGINDDDSHKIVRVIGYK